jgi:hypothetical protein
MGRPKRIMEGKKMVKAVSLSVLLLMVFVFGCSSTVIEGKRIDTEKMKQLVIGQTSDAKVEELFGKPAKIEKADPGIETYIYSYSAIQSFCWTIDRVGKEKLELGMRNGILKYYRFVWEEEDTVLRE